VATLGLLSFPSIPLFNRFSAGTATKFVSRDVRAAEESALAQEAFARVALELKSGPFIAQLVPEIVKLLIVGTIDVVR
jgi:hypothetical protein